MSEGSPLDPAAIREAREQIAHDLLHHGSHDDAVVRIAAITTLLAALDEGAAASAPFAAEAALWDEMGETRRIADGDLTVAHLRRLAAWHEAVSEPKGENDDR